MPIRANNNVRGADVRMLSNLFKLFCAICISVSIAIHSLSYQAGSI